MEYRKIEPRMNALESKRGYQWSFSLETHKEAAQGSNAFYIFQTGLTGSTGWFTPYGKGL
jgi:hypothetical protein